jgi:hypothetical protein
MSTKVSREYLKALVLGYFPRFDFQRSGINGGAHERIPLDDWGEIARHLGSTPQRSCQWAKPARQGRKRASRAAIDSENGVTPYPFSNLAPLRISTSIDIFPT